MNRVTCVETYPWFVGHQRVVGKSLIDQRILDDECFFIEDRVATKRDVTRRLASMKSLFRLEPLAIRGDEADQAYFNVEKPLGHASNAIEAFLGDRIEDSQ